MTPPLTVLNLLGRDMRKPVTTGVEGMDGGVGKVIQDGPKSERVLAVQERGITHHVES
jgi:hypothetical protein